MSYLVSSIRQTLFDSDHIVIETALRSHAETRACRCGAYIDGNS